MVFPIAGGTQDTGYDISNSLRFNDNDSARLTREFDQDPTGNRKTFTISCWVKRSNISSNHAVVSASTTNNFNDKIIGFRGDTDGVEVNNIASGNDAIQIITNRKFRDVSSWYHIVVAIDTTQSALADGVKFYVNGTRDTSFSGTPVYNQNATFEIGRSGSTTAIGMMQVNSSQFFDGYLSDFYFIDGQQLAPTEFGETNDNGVWIPKQYTGTFGNNGFKLEFKQTGTSQNSSGIGADTSGNDQHFAVTNLAAIDQTTDTPTNNYATLSIINKFNSPVVAEGALEFDSNSSSGSSLVSTIAPSDGKWYVEVKALTSTIHIGVAEVGLESFNVKGLGASRPTVEYQYGDGSSNNIQIDGSLVDAEAAFTTNDIIGIALNLDDGEVIFYKNGTALNSGTAYNLHTNTTHGNTGFAVQTATGSGNTKASFNFGNPAFSISSGNSDANGYGNFEYSVPSGYYALNTKNLAEYG
tara:strand:- start:275 stop:1681 length:1407 start_codon:yes stop_codon:yes gene_type:complete